MSRGPPHSASEDETWAAPCFTHGGHAESAKVLDTNIQIHILIDQGKSH